MFSAVVRNVLISLMLLIILASHQANASILRQCRQESQVSFEALKKLENENYETNDPKVKCYVLCIMQRFGVLNKDTQLDFDRIRRLPPEISNLLSRYADCGSLSGTDSCDTAFRIAKCIHGQLKDHGPYFHHVTLIYQGLLYSRVAKEKNEN